MVATRHLSVPSPSPPPSRGSVPGFGSWPLGALAAGAAG